MKPRKLTVINIEDEHPLQPSEYADKLEVINVSTELDIQRIMREIRSGQRNFAADVFVMDVNMKEKKFPADLIWGTSESVRPLGPMMALPFLLQGECIAFNVYSNYWNDPDVSRNAYVLLALSVLFSATFGSSFTLSETRDHIAKDASNRSLFKERGQALIDAIQQYRDRLKELAQNGKISITNMEELVSRVERLEEAYPTDRPPLPFSDSEGELHLAIRWASMRQDKIELSSLFADKLLQTNRKVLRDINKELGEFPQTGGEPDWLFNLAVDCLKKAETECSGKEYILDVIEREVDKFSKDKKRVDVPIDIQWRVRRLVVEFAWVRAWLEETTPEGRLQAVREYLGFRVKSEAPEDPGHMSNLTSKQYPRLVAGGNKIITDNIWRKPFKPYATEMNDAYKLDQDEPACLTPSERQLCQQYAEAILDWQANDRAYPAWMTQSV